MHIFPSIPTAIIGATEVRGEKIVVCIAVNSYSESSSRLICIVRDTDGTILTSSGGIFKN